MSTLAFVKLPTRVSIPALAEREGMSRWSLRRQLVRLHEQDIAGDAVRRARGEPLLAGWLYRETSDGPWRVNEQRLRASHPERYGVPEPAEVYQQLLDLVEQHKALRRTVNALHASFREHRKDHERGDV